MNTFKNPMTLEVDCRMCGKTVNLVIEQEDFKKFTLERKLQYINEATIIQPLGNAGGSGKVPL